MPEHALLVQRVEIIEAYLDQHRGNVRAMEKTVTELNTTLLLLKQIVESLQEKADRREASLAKIMWIAATGFIGAAVTFIISGGLKVDP